MSSETTRELVEVLLVRIGDKVYGIETGHVVEVFETPDLSPVPGTDDEITGIARHRGEVTVFLDPGTVLDTTIRGDTSILVNHEGDETPIALLVDEVLAMQRFDTRAVAPADEFDIDIPIFAAGVATEEELDDVSDVTEGDPPDEATDILAESESLTSDSDVVVGSGSLGGEEPLALICPRGLRKYTESHVAT